MLLVASSKYMPWVLSLLILGGIIIPVIIIQEPVNLTKKEELM
jgi:hypothetical protein